MESCFTRGQRILFHAVTPLACGLNKCGTDGNFSNFDLAVTILSLEGSALAAFVCVVCHPRASLCVGLSRRLPQFPGARRSSVTAVTAPFTAVHRRSPPPPWSVIALMHCLNEWPVRHFDWTRIGLDSRVISLADSES